VKTFVPPTVRAALFGTLSESLQQQLSSVVHTLVLLARALVDSSYPTDTVCCHSLPFSCSKFPLVGTAIRREPFREAIVVALQC
jgi:hypothetical protein